MGVVMLRMAIAVGVCVTVLSGVCLGQTTAQRARRAGQVGQAGQAVEEGGVLVTARRFVVSRAAERVLLAYVDGGPRSRGQLRTGLFTVGAGEGDGGVLTMTRGREDVTVAEDAREVAVAWGAGGGLLVWIAPREERRGERRQRRRRENEEIDLSDPLGPVAASGGEVRAQRIDPEGRPVGAVRVVARENQRLHRIDVLRRAGAEGYTVAWTGGAVRDGEVQGTARVVRVDGDGVPERPMATATGFLGDFGGFFRLVNATSGEGVTLAMAGWQCRAMAGEAQPVGRTDDPSERIERPDRRLMPQRALREVSGPPIECSALGLFTVEFQGDGRVGNVTPRARLRSVAGAISGHEAVVAVEGTTGVRRVSLEGAGVSDLGFHGRGIDYALRSRVEEEPVHLQAVQPEGEVVNGNAMERVRAPRGVAVTSAGVVAVTTDHTAVVRVSDGEARPLVRSAVGFTEVMGEGEVMLTGEGDWNGPVRFFWAPRVWAEAEVVTLDESQAHGRNTERYFWDEGFAGAWVRARYARAVFLRYENMAGAMAARPEAVTDPRMPGIVSRRNQLRGRWESACGALRTRAGQLVRHGAGRELNAAVGSLCQLNADLQLGVPVNQAL